MGLFGGSSSLSADAFIDIYPRPFAREIIVNFKTMETGVVTVELEPFAAGRYPVTNEQYHHFLMETGYLPGCREESERVGFLAHWGEGMHPPEEKRNHPVTFVSLDDALAYAAFVGGRLPSYHEWLYAAYGNTSRRYPWGDIFSPELCNVREGGIGATTPVGQYSPRGDSPFGCSDMIGNVWEWTSTPFDEAEGLYVAVGTGWDHYSFQTEIPLDKSYRNRSVGFRVVRDLG
jgi:formylglycine-generating enzyme required for sulfatase activity